MREFLSQNGVEYEERNVARDARWRQDLLARRGELVVPVLVVGDQEVVGLDEERMAALLGLEDAAAEGNWDGLEAPETLSHLPRGGSDTLGADMAHFARRIQKEMEFNARKQPSPYRQGQHDGMRFARDAILRILADRYEPEEPVIERPPGQT